MAAYDIQKHFSGLRVQTARRRKDPFASGFSSDDDSNDNGRKSRTKTKAPAVVKPKPPTVVAPPKTSISSPFAAIDALRDTDDDFLDIPSTKRTNRRPSPAPVKLAAQRVIDGAGRRGSLPGALSSSDPKAAVLLAAGPLAYLDETSSDDEAPPRPQRTDRRPSPAPAQRKASVEPYGRSQTPCGTRISAANQSPKQAPLVPPKHTVASAFAGTKYLQDSDSDEEAVSSRKNSAESVGDAESSEKKVDEPQKDRLEVKRVDKPKQNGSGVSWRAFSASRIEQRNAEIEALQASLRQRGRVISFCPQVVTDDGRLIPLGPTSARGPGPLGPARAAGRRGKSPPRRAKDTEPEEDEMADREPIKRSAGLYDAIKFKMDPFSGQRFPRNNSDVSPEPTDGDDKRLGSASDGVPNIRIDNITK